MSRAFAVTLVVTSAALCLSGCFAASTPVPSSAPDAADTASDTKAESTFGCLERARVIDPEEVIAYHVTSFVGLRTDGAPELGMSLSGRYVIGFEDGTFRVEPAMSLDMTGGGQAVRTRQTGLLTGHYSIDADGVITTSEVVDDRRIDPAVDPSSGLAAATLRRVIDHNPIEGAVAQCRGDDLVLKLSKAGGGLHTGVNLPAD